MPYKYLYESMKKNATLYGVMVYYYNELEQKCQSILAKTMGVIRTGIIIFIIG